jgi:hypothetical protein
MYRANDIRVESFRVDTNEVRISLMGVAPVFLFRKRVVGDDNISFDNVFRTE